MTRAVAAILLTLAMPAAALASLGGSVESIETDRAQTKSALMRLQRVDGYSVHEMLSPAGTTIREYYGSNGLVFGVAWDGEWPPDLRQLFGTYFERYQRAVQSARPVHKARGRLALDDNGLIVRSIGHSRSFAGIAYAPALMPAGVAPDVVR